MSFGFSSALHDFRQARRQAAWEQIIARLTGKSADLLSYEDVRKKLKLKSMSSRGVQDIPLDAIVGSVGRYHDFSRRFLPRLDSDAARWARVKTVTDRAGLPPIEVYKIGEVYFVVDGNHRVSIARQVGATHIQAYVTEVKTTVNLTPDTQPEDLILKARCAEFLERTKLDEYCPKVDFSLTELGKYRLLDEHIEVHRFFMGLEQKRDISLVEAARHWYDEVYLPVVQRIRAQGLLRDFPHRTETDLYLWIMEHKVDLAQELGWDISPEASATHLMTEYSYQPKRMMARMGEKLVDVITPDAIEAGPPPGQWRHERLETRRDKHLFVDILVPLSGQKTGWYALEQALEIARHEQSKIFGLHIVSHEADKSEQAVKDIGDEFMWRCEAAFVKGHFSVEVGEVVRTIGERTQWADLIVMYPEHLPSVNPITKLGSGSRTIIRRWSRPLLRVNGTISAMGRVLLAYDGSPKAREALFVATYMAQQWGASLIVLSVRGSHRVTEQTVAEAQTYLEGHQVRATYLNPQATGPVSEIILSTAAECEADLIIMGGYGAAPVFEVVFGSAVDGVLRVSQQPMLICR